MAGDTIEGMARIISPDWFGPCPEALDNYPDQHLGYQQRAREKAYAVLAIVRRPTDAMVKAGVDAAVSDTLDIVAATTIQKVFTAMIDAARGEYDAPTPT